MKNSPVRSSVFTFTMCTILSAAIFTSCNNSPKEKLDDATTDVVDASADLVKANDAYLAEVVAFKADAETQIAANEQKIKEYNTDLKIKKNNILKKKMAELVKKTADLKQKLVDFKAEDGKETWSEFKTEFNHDMEGLGTALSDLTTQNTKK
jgi:hypothetical protein